MKFSSMKIYVPTVRNIRKKSEFVETSAKNLI